MDGNFINNNNGASNGNMYSNGQDMNTSSYSGNQDQYMGNSQYGAPQNVNPQYTNNEYTNSGQYYNNQFNNTQYDQGYQNYGNVPQAVGASNSATASLVLGILGLLSGGGLFSIIGLFLAVSAKKKGDDSGIRKAGFITSLIGVLLLVLILILVVVTIGLGVMVPGAIGYTKKSQEAAAMQTASNVHTAVCTAVLDPDAVYAEDYVDAMALLDDGVYMSEISKGDYTVFDTILETLDVNDGSEVVDDVKKAGGTDIYIDYDVLDDTCIVEVVGTDISIGDD